MNVLAVGGMVGSAAVTWEMQVKSKVTVITDRDEIA